MSIFNDIIPFFRKINPKKGIFQKTGIGSPEGLVIGYVGEKYFDTSSSNLYEKASGENTNTGWILISGSSSASSLPVGAVMHFYDAVPTGFFELNGATFDQALYPALYAVNNNSNQLPDFRGYFIRALGTNSNGVASGSLRSLQDDATAKNGLQTSRLTRVERSGDDVNSNNAYPPADGVSGWIESGANDRYRFYNSILADSVSSADTETRPYNVALYIGIKHD